MHDPGMTFFVLIFGGLVALQIGTGRALIQGLNPSTAIRKEDRPVAYWIVVGCQIGLLAIFAVTAFII